VTPESIGWNVVELADSLADTYGVKTVAAAAQQCREKGDRPVAYFFHSAESMCAEIAAQRQADDAAEADQKRRDAEEAERRAEADRKREAAEAEIENLICWYAVAWWSSEPASADRMARRELQRDPNNANRRRPPVEQAAILRRKRDTFWDDKFHKEHRAEIEAFLARHAEWCASRS
jgi:hypothetical protein